MKQSDELEKEVETLRDRLVRLSEASLRLNDSLDFEIVLQGALDSARSLADAAYGVITLFNDAGEIQHFLASGMSPEESQQLWSQPGGTELADYLSKIQQPLRLKDFDSHIRRLGLPEFRLPLPVNFPMSFLAAPIRNRGERIGYFFLAEKDRGQAFAVEDEKTLVMFASQAALVIANARRYQEEQKARIRLQTLIDTSPVGVAVFNVLTGEPISFNRETARILDSLRMPDSPPEQLLDVLTFRRADGRETSLQEFSLAQALSGGETVRAEEITITVPDGRSVNTLVNATPIRAEEAGEVDSFVVTLQDMTAFEEVERLRAEFLATMSHELRVPLASIKGSAATVLTAPSSFGPAEMVQFFRMINQQSDYMSDLINDLLDVARIEAGTLSIFPEPSAVAELVDQARNTFVSGGGRNELHIDLPPDLPWVMADRRRIVQVMNNLLSNASRHSPERSDIRVSAAFEDVHVAISVTDDGVGLSAELLPRLFRKFSPGSDDRGSGLGLAICRGIVETHGGRIWAESDGPDKGARVTFTLPVAIEEGSNAAPSPPTDTAPAQSLMGRDRTRILVLDDDPKTLRYVRETLSRAGFEPVITADPQEALHLLVEKRPQLVLLDLMLPGRSGIDLMNDILNVGQLPIIFLSVYGHEDVVARAFDMGAVDYIVKPFSKTELVARIKAALRRQEVSPLTPPYRRQELTIDYAARAATLAGRPVRLTAMEYRLLAELSANAGRTLSYDHLMQRVWSLPGSRELGPLRTAVKTLRRKLGDDAANPSYLFTDPKVGYRMAHGDNR